MFFGDGVGGGMDCFAPLKTYCDKGDRDGSRDAVSRSHFDFTLYPGL